VQLAEHARNELAARQTRRRMTELSDHQPLSLTGLGEEEAENVLFACGACRQPLMDRGDRPSVPTTSHGSRRSTLMSTTSSIHRRLSARSPVVEHPHCNNPIASIPTSRVLPTPARPMGLEARGFRMRTDLLHFQKAPRFDLHRLKPSRGAVLSAPARRRRWLSGHHDRIMVAQGRIVKLALGA
jgi:hypothetical protein